MKNAWKSPVGGAALIILLTVVAYIPALRGGFIWDDDSYVTDNTTLRTMDGLRRIWFEVATKNEAGVTPQYYPLTSTSFWLDYHLWQLAPSGYHVINIGLHALNAMLVFLALRKLGVRGAWLAGAIFALHPVHVESVAWITERKNVLSGFFYLGALLAYLRFLTGSAIGLDFGAAMRSPVTGIGPKPWKFYWLAIGLYGCALLSKSVTCSLPVTILLLVWWKRGRLGWRDVAALLPFLALGLGLGLITMKAENPQYALSALDRCLVAGRNLWFYAGKLAWPQNLTFVYPRWHIDAGLWWPWLYPVGAVGVIVGLWRLRERWGRGALVGVLFFVVTLLPASGFFGIFYFHYSYVADHFQYLASVGLIALAASGGTGMCERLGPRGRSIGAVTAAVLLTALGTLTWGQTHVYRNLETLWRDTLAKNPQCWLAHNNLGVVLKDQGKVPEAIAQYEQALRIDPNYHETYYNLGVVLQDQGKVLEAIAYYERALQIEPKYPEAHNNLGNALAQTGRMGEAIAHYEQALQIKPDYARAQNNLGNVFMQEGKVSAAIGHYEEALRIKPDYVKAHDNLGNALAQTGRIEEAIAHYKQALRIKPDDAEAQSALARLQAQRR